MRHSASLPALLCGLCLLSACGGGGSSSTSSQSQSQSLAITAVSLPQGTSGAAYGGSNGFSLTASGGVAPYTWKWTAATGSVLPPGLSLSAAGLISGMPTMVASYALVVTVTDSSSPAARTAASYTLSVVAPAMLGITSTCPPDGTLGAAYDGGIGFTLTASGGVAPYTWNWNAMTGSSLPTGLSLSPATGVISGTTTAIGSYIFDVGVTDSQSPPATTMRECLITVGSGMGLTITSGAPPIGIVGTSYGGTHVVNPPYHFQFTGFPLSATEGTPGYSWSWASAPGASLPPGLSVSVLVFGSGDRCCISVPVIGGTPTAAGIYDVVVTVTDSASPPVQMSASYTITISP